MPYEPPASNRAENYPAVPDAFAFVVPSYQLMATRFEAADTRLTTLLTTATSLTLGGPLFARAVRPDISFESPVLRVALACAAIGIVCGVVGRVSGRITLANPRVLFDTALRYSAWEFKKNAIFYAGKHFDANKAAIRQKGIWANCLMIALLIEVWMLVLWIAV
jgi:hypothetical protein